MKRAQSMTASGYLGIEGGGTRTVARFESGDPLRVCEKEFGPGNVRLLDEAALRRLFLSVAQSLPRPLAVGIGMAGARTAADRERIRRAAARAWPGVPCYATNDLETALMAAEDRTPSARRSGGRPTGRGGEGLSCPRVLVLSGTG